MSRRSLLSGAAALFGAELCAPLARALAAEARPGFDAGHSVFSPDQRVLVAAISQRIVPTTDTPGAIAAGVPAFIEMMLGDWYEATDRTNFLDGIGRIDGHAQVRFNAGFAALTPYEQDEILTAVMHGDVMRLPPGFFAQCRQLVVLGYYTSEIGCRQERIYVPVPGRYDGKYPYAGKVFSRLMAYDFDAIVIGSGISGGWAAKELTEKGLKVLMLDRGRMVEHKKDYITEGKGPWQLAYRGNLPPAQVERDFQMAKWGGAGLTQQTHYYNNDRLNPIDYENSKPFRWVRPAQVGGKSLIWGRVALRWSDIDFGANRRDGHGSPWPLRYDDIAPWYSHVESFAGISGSREGLPQLPDGEFQPPFPMNAGELWVKDRLEKAFPGRKLIASRTANMTQDKPEQGRSRCQDRNMCARGCSFGAYFSTQSSTLPAARKTGNLTLMSDQVVTNLEYDPKKKRVSGVRVVDANTMQAHTYTSRIVFLCASAMASTQILLNSRLGERSAFDSSGMLGRYIMDHAFRTDAWGTVPDAALDPFIVYGRRPNGVYLPRFRNLDGQDRDADFVRGYGYQAGASRQPLAPSGFGADMKQAMRGYGLWTMGLSAFGECLPYQDNTLTLNPDRLDRYGVPLAVFNVTFRENEMRMMRDAALQGEAMLRAAGLVNVASSSQEHVPGDAIHEMGGACMGDDPRAAVVNPWSQAHDAANLFVTDGAQMASTSCVNPSMTFMALTARAADRAATLVKANAL